MTASDEIHVLLVEDNPTDALIVREELAQAPGVKFVVTQVEQLKEALAQVAERHFDVVLLDLSLPDSDGFGTFVKLHAAAPVTPIVVLSGGADGLLAVQAVQAGAQDYLVKGRIGEDVLPRSIRYAIERRRSERSLAESEERYRLLIEHSPDAYLVHCEGRIVFANATSLEMFGAVERKELLGQVMMDRVSPEFREVVIQRIQKTHFKGANPPLEVLCLRLDGSPVMVEATSNPSIHEGKAAVQVVLRDVTARKSSEERVREQAAMLDQAHDAIIVRDIHTRLITFWNRGAERLYGWTAKEALGRNIRKLIFASPNAPDQVTIELLKTGEWHGEHRHVTKAGKELTVSGHATLVRDAKGAPKSALVINIDVTAQKALEILFLRAQRMESIGTLAGGIAHDLNNVLAPIMMSIDLLRLTTGNERSLAVLSTIECSARRGADMVRQILSFARGMEGQRVEIDPRAIVIEMRQLVQDTFPKNIVFQACLPGSLPAIIGDPTQLHQVLLNLCVNARDAMPDGGSLTMTAGSLMVDEQYAAMTPDAKPGTYVMFKVADTGTGIPQAVVDKIFEPFFTTKEMGKGTGLGLSTALTIVKSHGGFLCVQSDPGKGTAFTICLPASDSAQGAVPTPNEATYPRGQGEMILVVDDEAAVRAITQQTLEAFGYRVLVAADGAEAVTLYAEHQHMVSAVLTDMMMPGMDGSSTIQTLKSMNASVPIVAASGLNSDGGAARAARMGVKDFLPKPYTAQTVLMTLSRVIGERR
ncbi:MAG: hybrid sensor histidine kinase/response regulator [Verrucomicrobiaceae bacterium]|nr:hybrid sensor histidine kinase/response regulator [Verrucomicrobiaceae bacterium]